MFYLISILPCIVIAVVVGVVIPQKATYNKLDKAGFVWNIILTFFYMPMSLLGMFLLLWIDPSWIPESYEELINIWIVMSAALSFVSVCAIFLSVVFRKNGKRKLSFIIQFVPAMIFVILAITTVLV